MSGGAVICWSKGMCEVFGQECVELSVTCYALLFRSCNTWLDGRLPSGFIWCSGLHGTVVMTLITIPGTLLAVHMMTGVGAEQALA